MQLSIIVLQICKNSPAYEGKFGEKDWNSLDTSYRILADHSRTITACLADGMIPEEKYASIFIQIELYKKMFSVRSSVV